MSILVTGGSSALAHTLTPHLQLSFGMPVYSVIRGDVKTSSEIKCDLRDKKELQELVKKLRPKLIYHLAASSTNDFDFDLIVNAQSSRWIYESLLQNKIKSRVVVIGSAAEYGVVSGDTAITEHDLLRPVTTYGLTKKIQSELAFFYADKGVDVLVARIFNLAISGLDNRLLYGRAENFIYDYQRGLVNKLKVGNLGGYRDYVGGEIVSAMLIALGKKGVSGEVYNVGSGRAIKVEDLIRDLFWAHGIRNFDEIVVQDKSADIGVPTVYSDIKKISALL